MFNLWIMKTGRWLTKRRGILLAPFFTVILLSARPSSSPRLEFLEVAAGFFCLWAGHQLRLLAASYHESNDSTPITAGPYAWIRHPLYVANFLLGLGIVFIAGWWVNVIVYFLFFLAVHVPIARAEELHLAEIYGQNYADYRKAVPAVLPWRRYTGARYGERRTLKLESGRESLKAFGYIAGGLAVWLMRRYRPEWPHSLVSIPPSFFIIPSLLVLWAVVYRTKTKSSLVRAAQTILVIVYVFLISIHTTKRTWVIAISISLAAGTLVFLQTADAAKTPAMPPRPAPDLEVGRQTFLDNCARCHGLTGAGDGIDAKRMMPLPRKLSEGIFKFRTTASGTPPKDEDLFRTISTGLPGSRMPDFQRLPEETRWQLVYYVKSLSKIFQEQRPEPIDIGHDPSPAKTNLTKGKELYTQLGCNACHGNLGRGNGPSAATLVDNWGKPIRAADLTHAWTYRGGSTPQDIATRLMTGIDGTPMPSYADAVSSKEDAWQLAYYVHSIQEPTHFGHVLEAAPIQGALPARADDPAWDKASRVDLRLSSNFYEKGEILATQVNAVSAQALYNETDILFRLRWHDPSESRSTPPDALALLLPVEPRVKVFVGSVRSWPAKMALSLDVCYWPANAEKAREASVPGLHLLEFNSRPSEPVETQASYADGEWTVLVKRPLKPTFPGAVKYEPNVRNIIGITVWDGGNGEQVRRRANSNWVDLILKTAETKEKKKAHKEQH